LLQERNEIAGSEANFLKQHAGPEQRRKAAGVMEERRTTPVKGV
jgi:hypothetical protein